jgi:hypothetical protein
MKKSFLYAAQVALITALLFTGCPQDSDDDDDSGGKTVNTPGSDLSYIAYAFGYGVDTVQVVNDIYLESYELVIPAGKTLDFRTTGKSLRGITDESKIIAQGTLILADTQAPLDFAKTPGAKIIADADFIRKYVVVNYYTEDPAAPTGKWTDADWGNAGITDLPSADKNDTSVKIFATWKQIVLIDTFENFKTYDKDERPGLVFIDEISGQPKYLAISAPQREINGDDVEVINEKAGGLRFYLVGEPVRFNFNGIDHVLDLAKNQHNRAYYKTWKPEPGPDPAPDPGPDSGSVFYMGGNSGAPSLTIAGNMYISNGQINAPGGLTVWGIVENRDVQPGSTVITNGNTPFTAWTAFLYGASFGGPVNLPGSITNNFGGKPTFGGELQIAGPVTFQGGIFKGEALFGGPVQFIKSTVPTDDDIIVFEKNVTFADDVQLNDSVVFNASGTYYKNITGVDFDIIDGKLNNGSDDVSFTVSGDEVKKPKSGSYSVDVVVPGENVKVQDDIEFTKDATFEGNVTFEKGTKIIGNATFEGDVTFTGEPKFGTISVNVGDSPSTITEIKGLAVFNSGADFGGTVNTVGGSPLGNTVVIEEAEFKGGAFKNIAELKLGDSETPAITLWTGDIANDSAGSGSITLPADGGITFKGNTLTFTGGGGTLGAAIAFNNAEVKLGEGASMNFAQNPAGYPITVMQAGSTGGGFKIEGKAKLDGGVIIGEDAVAAVVKADGGVILTVPGGPVHPISNTQADIHVRNATIDLSSGGAIVFAGTASRIALYDNANIKLSDDDDGLAIPKGQTYNGAVIMAGKSGGSAALLTGSEGIPGGTFVGTVSGGTFVVGETSWNDSKSNMLNNSNRFTLVGTFGAAGSIIVGQPVSGKFSNTNSGSYVAVFTQGPDNDSFYN